jgi:hypothetical protein
LAFIGSASLDFFLWPQPMTVTLYFNFFTLAHPILGLPLLFNSNCRQIHTEIWKIANYTGIWTTTKLQNNLSANLEECISRITFSLTPIVHWNGQARTAFSIPSNKFKKHFGWCPTLHLPS